MLNTRVLASVSAALIIVSVGIGCGKKEISFRQDVHPILRKNCSTCHAPGREGFAASGFSVESFDAAMKGTKFGPVIIPGSTVSSTLVILIEHKADASINMPRHPTPVHAMHEKFLTDWKVPKLPEGDIRLIKAWIDQGAKNN